ncbi:MAG TPA: ABC transporter permease [Verrucomicrobiae bacterium]|nr:ABC transporter permease [Verrucomicrobiae bacterium]
MNLRSTLARLLNSFRKFVDNRDVHAELHSHLQLHIDDNLSNGMTPQQARRDALLKLGGLEQTKQAVREQRTLPLLESLLQDARFAARLLKKSPVFTAIAVLTLALGIGANTAMFSLVNSVLFRSLPYYAPDQLVWLSDFMPRQHDSIIIESDYYAWLAQNHVFTDVAAYDPGDTLTLTNAGEPARLRAAHITYNFLNVLGVSTALGRSFREDEDRPGAPHVALLSDELWRSRFAANPAIVGRSLEFDGDLYTVVGVLPPNFEFLDNSPAQVLTPLALENHEMTMQKSMRIVNVVARLRPGITLPTATKDIDAINQRLFASYPPAFANMFRGARAEVTPLRERLLGKSRPALVLLLGAVAFVLLIACANIASLQLARSISREKEIAIRSALGAGKSRVIRQLLTENVMLAVAGGLCGLFLASGLVRFLVRIAPNDVPHLALARLDLRVLTFTLAATVLCGALFGLAPALAALRPKLTDSLKEAGAQPSATRLGRRSQRILVVAELAAALILLTGSGLLLKSFHCLASIPAGFDANGVFTARVSLPPNQYSSDTRQSAFFQQLLARCSALPGVSSAAVASILPLQGSNSGAGVEFEGRPAELPGRAPAAEVVKVSPGYFQALRIPVLSGDVFDPHKPQSDAKLLVVNQAFAKRFLPNESPLGRRVILGKENSWTISGVVADSKQFGLDAPVKPSVFISIATETAEEMTLILRTPGVPATLLPAVRSIVADLDKNLPLYDVLSMQDLLRDQTASQRFSVMLLSAFAALAVLLSCLGVYGVTAYAVSQRTREFGLRMALGAQPRNILSLVLRQVAWLSVFGVLLGIAASLTMSKLIVSLLFETQPTDPAIFLTVTVLLFAVVLLACFLPARRASQVDPNVALRYE